MTEPTIGVVGGTGPQGRGLAFRLAAAGYDVTLGSRTLERAVAAADNLNAALHAGRTVRAESNAEAARTADVVIVAIPYDPDKAGLIELGSTLAGKIVVSCANPLGFDASGPYGLGVPEGSAAEQLAAAVPDAAVVGAFHHVSARNLMEGVLTPEDILVCGDDAAAKSTVIGLATAVGGRPGIDAGPLRMSRYLEPMTAVLISINKRYRIHAGVSITGLPASA